MLISSLCELIDQSLMIHLSGTPIPDSFITKSFLRSRGPGGQNVNKVSSRVRLQFRFSECPIDPALKEKLFLKFPSGLIAVTSDETRHQHMNLALATSHLQGKIDQAFERQEIRYPSKPFWATKGGKRQRVKKRNLLKWRAEKEGKGRE